MSLIRRDHLPSASLLLRGAARASAQGQVALTSQLGAPIGAEPEQPAGPPASGHEHKPHRHRADPEPSSMFGMVYAHHPHGHVHTLALSGQTTPQPAPGCGPLIPDKDAPDGRVVFFVDGIQQSRAGESHEINSLLQSSEAAGCDVRQPVIAVHEGKRASRFKDIARITREVFLLKEAQMPWANTARLLTKCGFDPAVKALHDELRQSMDAGRTVTLAAFSGGGEEAALALQLLSLEDGGAMREQLAERVRVLALSPAASREDFLLAGIRPQNLYLSASRKDPLYKYSKNFVHPFNLVANIPAVIGGLNAVAHLLNQTDMRTHNTHYIFGKNVTSQGDKPIQAFLDGGPGGQYIVS
jgi:hypothetical protein